MSNDQPNATNKKQLKRAQARENFEYKTKFKDYIEILDTAPGRRILWDLMDEAGIYQTSFTGNNTTFLNEGRRQIGLIIMANITQAKPEAILQMMLEAKKREESNG